MALPPLTPPFRFGIVASSTSPPNGDSAPALQQARQALYRGAYPKQRNLPFLSRLHLRTVVSLTPKPLAGEARTWADERGVRCIWVKVEKVKEEETVDLDVKRVVTVLQIITHAPSLPLYLHCLDGVDVTSLVVGCLRKLQAWTHASIMAEFSRYLRDPTSNPPTIPSSHGLFIEKFQPYPVPPSSSPSPDNTASTGAPAPNPAAVDGGLVLSPPGKLVRWLWPWPSPGHPLFNLSQAQVQQKGERDRERDKDRPDVHYEAPVRNGGGGEPRSEQAGTTDESVRSEQQQSQQYGKGRRSEREPLLAGGSKAALSTSSRPAFVRESTTETPMARGGEAKARAETGEPLSSRMSDDGVVVTAQAASASTPIPGSTSSQRTRTTSGEQLPNIDTEWVGGRRLSRMEMAGVGEEIGRGEIERSLPEAQAQTASEDVMLVPGEDRGGWDGEKGEEAGQQREEVEEVVEEREKVEEEEEEKEKEEEEEEEKEKEEVVVVVEEEEEEEEEDEEEEEEDEDEEEDEEEEEEESVDPRSLMIEALDLEGY